MRVNQRIRTVSHLLSVRQQINLNPMWQRGSVWGPEKQALLIDSILRQMDVPKLYLLECVAGAPSALEVAKALVRHVRGLPSWALRTSSVSRNALALRNLGLRSNDPNQLLFDDLPQAFAAGPLSHGAPLAAKIDAARLELEAAYPAMLSDLAATLMKELRFKGAETSDYGPIHRRSLNVRGLSGNFRLDALSLPVSIGNL